MGWESLYFLVVKRGDGSDSAECFDEQAREAVQWTFRPPNRGAALSARGQGSGAEFGRDQAVASSAAV